MFQQVKALAIKPKDLSLNLISSSHMMDGEKTYFFLNIVLLISACELWCYGTLCTCTPINVHTYIHTHTTHVYTHRQTHTHIKLQKSKASSTLLEVHIQWEFLTLTLMTGKEARVSMKKVFLSKF